MSLTHVQRELFNFIVQFTAKNNGVAPTFDQMKDALNLHSKSGVYRILTALEERGFVERLPNRARSIKIVDRTRYRELLGDTLADQLERAAKQTNISPTTAIRECVRAYIGDA